MNQDQESQSNKPEWEVISEGSEEQAPESASDGAGETAEQPQEASARPAYTGKTPGEMLREAREARNLSIQDVVTQTRITAETIRALEEDRDPPQNAWVYVRGYYRKYARSLGLSDDEVLQAHERYVGGAPEPEPVSAEWAPQDVSPTAAMPRFVVVLLIGILAGGLLWWLVPQLSGGSESADSEAVEQADTGTAGDAFESRQLAPETGSEEVDVASEPEPSAPSLSIFSASGEEEQGAEDTGASESEQAEAIDESSDESAGLAGSGETDDSAEAAGATTGPLVLIFTERSWVNIVDANNRKLLDGIVSAGKRHALDGQPPFRIFLGYAPGVEVVYKGQSIDTAPHTSSNNTARFKVGEQNDTETSATP